MRKLLVILLALCTLLVSVSFSGCGKEDTSNEIVDGYLTYVLQEDGTYSVRATDPNDVPETVVIPETFNGVSVTALEDGAFGGSTVLRKITLPPTITRIPAGAFYRCQTLVRVEIQGTLTGIGNGAMGLCHQHITIYYSGTRAEWGDILKAGNWATETEYSVICSDSSIS